VIREEKFLISHAPYAVKPETINLTPYSHTPNNGSETVTTWSGTIEAMWFRRKSGRLSAHYGCLHGHFGEDQPDGFLDFMAKCDDGRYGGNCWARWDGDYFWAPDTTWEIQKKYQAELDAALKRYGEIPDGCNGWWTYKIVEEK
jgi:hypothetical protein